MEYRPATLADVPLLAETRATVLRAANSLPQNCDMSAAIAAARAYYQTALANGSHTAFFAFHGGAFAGCGGASFYTVLPTWHNPTGKKAYIMNMCTAPALRRRGVARHILQLLVDAAKQQGAGQILLEATAAGRPLYKAFGFVPASNEMELPL